MTLLTGHSLAVYIPFFFFAWIVLLVFRRFFLHPLSKFPGPPLAALSPLYKSYYEVIKGGEWLNHVDKLHQVYGCVVRVGPNELHFNDYRAYSKIFSVGGHQFTKDPDFYACFGVETSTFGLIDPEKARLGRELLAPYFNRRSILQLESVIQTKVQRLIQLLSSRGKPADMFYAFRCATMDIITEHCFQSSSDCLDSPDFKAPLLMDIQAGVPLLWTLKSFPWILPVIPILPNCIGGNLLNQYRALGDVQSFVANRVLPLRQRHQVAQGIHSTSQHSESSDKVQSTSVYHQLLEQVPTLDDVRLMHEGLSLIQAGSDTVANTCVVGFFHILNNPAVHAKLVHDIKTAWPDANTRLSWAELEKIPYLGAVIKESLRMSYGFVSPMPRVVGACGTELCGHDIPPQTTVSISVTSIHNSPDIFPNPHQFRPERWLESRDLGQYLLAFSKGPRMCLGINMAWAELYVFFGTMFRQLDMAVVDTSYEDLADFYDYFIPIHKGRHLHIHAKPSTPL